MTTLRDRGISFFDTLADGKWNSPPLQQLQRDVATLSLAQRLIVRRCVTEAIDTAVHDFLFALQEASDLERDIQIVVDGQDVASLREGLHGELFGPNGWRAKYSRFGEAKQDN